MWSGTLRNFVLFSIIIVARLSKLIKCEPVTSLKGYCPQIPKPEDDENLRPPLAEEAFGNFVKWKLLCFHTWLVETRRYTEPYILPKELFFNLTGAIYEMEAMFGNVRGSGLLNYFSDRKNPGSFLPGGPDLHHGFFDIRFTSEKSQIRIDGRIISKGTVLVFPFFAPGGTARVWTDRVFDFYGEFSAINGFIKLNASRCKTEFQTGSIVTTNITNFRPDTVPSEWMEAVEGEVFPQAGERLANYFTTEITDLLNSAIYDYLTIAFNDTPVSEIIKTPAPPLEDNESTTEETQLPESTRPSQTTTETTTEFSTSPASSTFKDPLSTTTRFPENESSPEGEGPMLALILVGVILLLIFGLGLVICIVRKRSQTSPDYRKFQSSEIHDPNEPVYLPAISHHPHILDDNGHKMYQAVQRLPLPTHLHLSPKRLKVQKSILLGKGAFGVVFQGLLDSKTVIAVKTSAENADETKQAALLAEVKIMSYAGKHPNIVELVGVQFDKGGKGYLAPTEIETVKPFDTHTLLLWTKQVCSAMTFLSAKQIIHGDLAARNVLVDEHFVAKISDFGLSRQIYDQYKKYVFAKKETQLPWRWLAIETLKHSKFSSESDIWAFGVFMWEMFSLGDTPYTAGSQWGPEFVSFLDQGLRLEAPEYARQEIYLLMRKCWEADPSRRSRFPEISSNLDFLLASEYENRIMPKK